jgi:polysaccharide pyruvyl transferase WcaK-like protein
MSAPRIVAFVGEWNTANLGDHAIREGVARMADQLGVEPLFVNLGSLSVGSGERRPSSPKLRSRIVSSAVGRRLLRPVRAWLRTRGLQRRLDGVALVVVGGGALLSTDSPQFPHSLAAIRRVARRLDVPVACLGCSTGGTWEGASGRAVAAFLSSCRVVATRDAGA